MPAPGAAQLVAHFGMTMLPVESTLFVSTYVSTARRPTGAPRGRRCSGSTPESR